jgi:hypothetical protein
MTAVLMEMKRNREHQNWWFRSSQFIVLPQKSILCAVKGKQSEEDNREHHCP